MGEEEEWKGEGLVGGRGEGWGGNIASASTARRASATAEIEAVAVVAAKKVGEEEWGGGRGGGGEREGVDQWVGGGEIEAVAVVAAEKLGDRRREREGVGWGGRGKGVGKETVLPAPQGGASAHCPQSLFRRLTGPRPDREGVKLPPHWRRRRS